MPTLYDKEGNAVDCRADQVEVMTKAGYKSEAPKGKAAKPAAKEDGGDAKE